MSARHHPTVEILRAEFTCTRPIHDTTKGGEHHASKENPTLNGEANRM
jgi:hypothetical protein